VKGPEVIKFYSYRAKDNETYPFGNCDGASAMAVIAYLHHEVVGLLECTSGGCIPVRKFGIDRIKRTLITMKNPPAVFNANHGQFGPWRPFDKAQCSNTDPNDVQGCPKRWEQYGFNVGCVPHPFNPNAKGEQYYDFPAECPLKDYTAKDAKCKAEFPGGKCIRPDGRRDCTWSEEDAGEVMLSDLEGIPETQWKTWENFQKNHVREFDKNPGQCRQSGLVGTGLLFWNNMYSWIEQKKRADKLVALFKQKYNDTNVLADPTCDGF